MSRYNPTTRTGGHVAMSHVCEVVDQLGMVASEEYCPGGTEDNTDYRWIRLEKETAEDLKYITTREAVQQQIQQVRERQGEFRRSDLYTRTWKNLDSDEESSEPIDTNGDSSQNGFSIAQFNTLAEGLSAGPNAKPPFPVDSSSSNYGGFTAVLHPSIVFDFALRKWRLLEVLLTSEDGGGEPCDIIAIEEMDRYRGFFAPMLNLFGFDGIFAPKPQSPCVRMGWYSDGCALFWKREKFELISSYHQQYSVGNQVMVVAVLKHRPTKKSIIVAVTHLKAKMSITNECIRHRQVEELLQCVELVADQVKRNDGVDQVPTVIAGDFNSEPPCHVNAKDSCIGTMIKQKGCETGFVCAYGADPPGDLYTTWKTRGPKTEKRIIDYIFYRGNLDCKATLDVPSGEELEEAKLPGRRYPSDHLMIAAKFRFR